MGVCALKSMRPVFTFASIFLMPYFSAFNFSCVTRNNNLSGSGNRPEAIDHLHLKLS